MKGQGLIQNRAIVKPASVVMSKGPKPKGPSLPGFTFVKEVTYTCGPYRSTVQEFRHERTGMEFVYLPGGTFQMGGNQYDSEKPIHKVTLSPYLIAKYECTQAEWQKIMGNNPSKFKGDRRPVEQVSWDDCQQFCQKAGLALPTEAQWEFACRAGSPGLYCFGDSMSQLGEYAWYNQNSGNQTHPVGEKKPNAFGLFDMHGNVWEWCQDWYGNYESGNAVDPKGPSSGSRRVIRGGCWDYGAGDCHCSYRYRFVPGYRCINLGFRCVAGWHA